MTNVSHDLRTPLTSASGYIGILERSGLDEKQAEFLAVVKGRIEAMKQLTEDLLAYSVILSEEAPAAGEVCVNDVLEDSLTQFFAAFAERGIEPQIDICAERVVRRADRGSLSRMFGNVISNAVRYSGGDFCASLSPEGEAVFENAAPQLDEVSAGKLFDRFFTVENARGSTGLGLSIARALVHDPDVVFLDEPYSGLDPHAVDIFDQLIEKQREDRTFVMVSHDLRKGFDMCTHALVLARGRVVTFGAKDQLDFDEFSELYRSTVGMGVS